MKVTINTHKCIAAGACVMESPEVFDQREEDGVVFLLTDNPSEELHASVRRATAACPAKAISLD